MTAGSRDRSTPALRCSTPFPTTTRATSPGSPSKSRREQSTKSSTGWAIGLLVTGTPLATVEVNVPARRHRRNRQARRPRRAYVEDLVRRCNRAQVAAVTSRARALVIRHRPERDEDNTWATWTVALTGRNSWSRAAWGAAGSPLAGWSPMAVASVADARLSCDVRYEIYRVSDVRRAARRQGALCRAAAPD